MPSPLQIAFFGSSLVSSYWNGAATYYRGLLHALAQRGHRIHFFEPDAFGRQQHRDIDDPEWAQVTVYPGAAEADAARALEQARGADVVVKASGVGVFDAFLEREVLGLRSPRTQVLFWDVDAPATLERVQADADDPFRAQIPRYDLVLTYGGGPRVVSAYRALGAAECVPIYNALDPSSHHPSPAQRDFAADLGFLGNRLPDREARVRQFFLEPARRLPDARFLLGGSGWDADLPDNVRTLGHVSTRDHNAFNCSVRMVLNVNRDSMARFGWSPPTRVFEAAGAGACLIVDAWEGIEAFLEPQREVLVAHDSEQVAHYLQRIDAAQAQAIGARARQRLLRDHTYTHRAREVEALLDARQREAA
ncbi:glycosyltransferase [Xanthomonas sontii]|uniref:CgeB family protein n=1 Tax=Xanthomonas sontii TaxID=2650745 RepID=UPI001478E4C1|nr:glycosyltransferase [Xanthomonas sontii]MDQ7759966.1 glycosyltransferase [Xanthomonas sontii]UZK07448.1 glycosyltransferase [Xanthomonas sontii]